MGMEGYTFKKYMDLIRKYSEQLPGEPEGALIIFADDAEYIGTNGWFRLKYQNKPDNVFEETPKSKENLIKLISEVKKLGEFVTFDYACNEIPALPDTINFDDDTAWHGAKASTWANTPMARLLRPWQDLVREKLRRLAPEMDYETLKKAWYHLTNSYNSDGQWPPTLPDAPHIIHPFNYSYCFENLLKAELLVGGVDRSRLSVNPIYTMKEILSIQQDLVESKAEEILSNGSEKEKADARLAKELVKKSRDLSSIIGSGVNILYSDEYRIRAEFLVEARRLVGGVELEKI